MGRTNLSTKWWISIGAVHWIFVMLHITKCHGTKVSTVFIPATFPCPTLTTSKSRVTQKRSAFSVSALSLLDDKQIWVEPLAKEVLLASIERGYRTFAFRNESIFHEWQSLARFEAVLVRDGRVVDSASEKDMGRWVRLHDHETQNDALALAGKEDLVVLDSMDWKIIPAENMIAAFQPTRTRLLSVVSTAAEAKVMLETLEVGTDGIVLRTALTTEVFALMELFHAQTSHVEELVDCQVQCVRAVGMGDRVCVDTCSLLGSDEGLLVGSAAQGLFLVLSEAAPSDYVPSRPFRVNAGPVHSYCLCPGGKTRYLGELQAGDDVLVVSATTGKTRIVTVGRVKVERRPLLLLLATTSEQPSVAGSPRNDQSPEEHRTPDTLQALDKNASETAVGAISSGAATRRWPILVQNAETVRLAGASGPVSVTRLSPAVRLKLRRDAMARHVGMPVNEWLAEA